MTNTYYNQCLKDMYSLRRFGIKLGLNAIDQVLSSLGNPQNKFKTVHISGTNGKGSIASALSTILCHGGVKTGLYTSPHLVRFNERICINNQPVSDDAVIEAYEAVMAAPSGERSLTFFEFTTAMALHIFARENVEWAVIETGMGGRLDATNILLPELCVISNISLEHQEYLGNTIEKIAGEKAGIIKPNTPVVTGVKQNSAKAVVQKIAEENNAPLYCLDEHFQTEAQNHFFDYSGISHTWNHLKTGLSGAHQQDNAAVTLAACELLMEKSVKISPPLIHKGLALNRWPGRLEVVCLNPLLILDGAHNLDAACILADFLKSKSSQKEWTLILGILDDKPYHEILNVLGPVCRCLILTQPQIYRALPVQKLYETAQTIVPEVLKIPDVEAAVNYALIKNTDGAVCVAGSLYVVGEAKQFLEKKGFSAFSLSQPA